MELDKLGVVTSFIHNIVVYNIPLLYGTVGEIVVEKSGSLNLGVEGIMAVGAIFGYICGCYANSLGVGIAVAFLAGALCGLLFAAMTVSLQANQNITGLTLTTFGLGVYFFVGNGLKAKAWPVMGDYAAIKDGSYGKLLKAYYAEKEALEKEFFISKCDTEQKKKAYEIISIAIPVIILILSTLSLVGDSYNPFLYFQF